jgi:hypothetical protein
MTVRRGGRRLPRFLIAAGLAATAALAATAQAGAAPAEQAALGAAVPDGDAPVRAQRPGLPAGMQAAEMVTAKAVTASAGLTDAAGDAGLAPDLQAMVALTSDDGRYSVGIALESNALIDGDYVVTFVNTDGNPATGEPTFGGADLAVTIIGRMGIDAVAAESWNGFGWQPANLPSLLSFASGATDEVWSVAAAEAGIVPGAATTLAFGTMYAGVYDDHYDFAPEPGAALLGLTAGALAPPPAAPAPAGLAAAPVAAPAGPPAAPLSVRAFGLTRTPGGVRLRMGWLDGTGAVRWTLRLDARVNGRAARRVLRGSGRAGARTVLRTVPLPRSWAGARVRARLELRDGSRTLVRTRSLRA